MQGLFFRKENWLGGYGSWTRRMMRLGHISFIGIALINITFAMTASTMGIENEVYIPSVLFIIAAVGMPLVCYLSAIKDTFRHLFFIPALSVIAGIVALLWIMLTR